MRYLSMAMLACLALDAEAAVEKHPGLQSARVVNQPDLARQLWITHAEKYKHKPEAEIARMTPAQRVDEYAEEQANHKYDFLDNHGHLIGKYIWHDGLKALPRMIEIMDEYDPTRASGKRGHKGERFDAMWMLLGDLDNHVVRLRRSEEGRRTMDALERAIQRMRAAGSGQEDQHEWAEHGRFESALANLEEARGINHTDQVISDTLKLEYKILLSKEELLEFSNFLVAHDSTYPSWSETNYFRDDTRINAAGNPLRVRTMKKPERFYQAFLEFKKTKR